jgi:hypothetical protein
MFIPRKKGPKGIDVSPNMKHKNAGIEAGTTNMCANREPQPSSILPYDNEHMTNLRYALVRNLPAISSHPS